MDQNRTTRSKALGADNEHIDAMVAIDLDQPLLDRRCVTVEPGIEHRRLARATQTERTALCASGLLGRKPRLDALLHTRIERMLT